MSIEPFWQSTLQTIKGLLLTADINDFPSWQPIRQTMLIGNCTSIKDKYYIMREQIPYWEWKDIWGPALDTTIYNKIERFDHFPTTDPNTIQQASHIYNWSKFSSKPIWKLDSIIEFGAGFGSMARLVRALGFKGMYYIYDLPELVELQKYYLSKFNIENYNKYVTWINNPQEACECDLLIGMWSLSESPIDLRDIWLKQYRHNSYLLGIAHEFGDINNIEYFERFMSQLLYYNWNEVVLGPTSKYLFGENQHEPSYN